MPQDIGYGFETPTNNGKVTRCHGEPSPIAELRRREADRPPTIEDSARMIGWLIAVLVCLGVLAALFLRVGP